VILKRRAAAFVSGAVDDPRQGEGEEVDEDETGEECAEEYDEETGLLDEED
jgi:hypothetical protein